MAVQVTLTDEQATWLVLHIKALEDDWHWNGRNRPSPDAEEHARTIRQKAEHGLKAGNWDSPGSQ